MKKNVKCFFVILFTSLILPLYSQIGSRFPSEKVIVKDSVTGVDLVFLTSKPFGDKKIYPTHNQWTSDGEWIVFNSNRVPGEAMAVNETTGDIVQVTEGGYLGILNASRKSMKLYFMRKSKTVENHSGEIDVIETDLEKLFNDSAQGVLQKASFYERKCGAIPAEMDAGGDMSLDSREEWIWFRVGKEEAIKHLSPDAKIAEPFGPRNMGAGPGGIAGMNIHTGEIKYVISVPFQIGHIQSNPWVSEQIVFCWETGGKAPQRTWIVNADGTELRPLYAESDYEWITHEAIISSDEVAFAIMGHRPIKSAKKSNLEDDDGLKRSNPGQEKEWGVSGTREKPTGLGIVNTNSKEVAIAGQIPYGSGFWHVHGSSDKRFLVGDNFERELYLINRQTNEMILISAGHKTTATDHVHPSFSPDGTKIVIQSAMISEDERSMNICVVPVPQKWLRK